MFYFEIKSNLYRIIDTFITILLLIDPIGNYVLVLAYANEGNLRKYLKNKDKFIMLKWKDKIRMGLDIACGLKCLHSEEIIHRDLVN